MTTAGLPPHVWFVLWRRRLWAVRREGRLAVAALAVGTILAVVTGLLVIGFAGVWPGVAVAAAGVASVAVWFERIKRAHADYTLSELPPSRRIIGG